MSTLNDLKCRSLRQQGFQGSLDDMLISFYKERGVDGEYMWLANILNKTGSLNDLRYEYLILQGFTGSHNDMLLSSLSANQYFNTFTPISLFSAGEQGGWYDPSDFSTMFQDSAGTTPVTAVEQPVGLMLDKSKGGRQSLDVTGWVKQSGDGVVTVSGNTVTITGATTTTRVDITTPGWAVGDYADMTMTGSVAGATGQTLFLGGGAVYSVLDGTRTFRNFIASSTLLRLQINTGSATFVVSSRGRTPGNHATQTTSTSRPVLSARYNLLTATATLATQTVITRATTQTLRFTGAGTVTLSGTATGTFSAGTHSVTTTAGNLTLTVSGTVTEADLRASNTGGNLPAYQRVNTATDYDTTGFPLYLKFDGVDDFLVTNSINFTATDKMTVFAGVRKLSDAGGTGMPVELSTDAGSANGSFHIQTSTNNYGFALRGTGVGLLSATTYAAPVTNVLSASMDIAQATIGSELLPKVNGVTPTLTTTLVGPAGTGNFGNYPLYIGRRGGITLPFNGHLYSLIVRGAQSNTGQIASAETWVAGKTGITL